eukprot:SAG11_NODE_1566_length_4673_cov_3.640796_1_plen_40_part_10
MYRIQLHTDSTSTTYGGHDYKECGWNAPTEIRVDRRESRL